MNELNTETFVCSECDTIFIQIGMGIISCPECGSLTFEIVEGMKEKLAKRILMGCRLN